MNHNESYDGHDDVVGPLDPFDPEAGQPGTELDDKVGYGKPPKQYQWPKGTSGNLKGRPKTPPPPDPPDLRASLMAMWGQQICVDGKSMTVLEQTLRGIVAAAIKGERRAINNLLEIEAKLPRRKKFAFVIEG
jgi:hypothetical protein